MRKLTAICFALLIATSAFASPRNESRDRDRDVPNPVTRIVRQIKSIIVHVLDDPTISVPIPAAH
jgi:hypothetical protein